MHAQLHYVCSTFFSVGPDIVCVCVTGVGEFMGGCTIVGVCVLWKAPAAGNCIRGDIFDDDMPHMSACIQDKMEPLLLLRLLFFFSLSTIWSRFSELVGRK